MLDPCPSCGHSFYSEVLAVGSFRMVAYFNNPKSGTLPKRVYSCPGAAPT